MPDELQEKKIQRYVSYLMGILFCFRKVTVGIRNIHASLAEHEQVGMALWRSVYGDTSDSVQKLLDDIYPDMGKINLSVEFTEVQTFKRHHDIRLFLENDWLRFHLWPYRCSIRIRNIIHDGGSTYCWGYSRADFVAFERGEKRRSDT